MTFFASCVHMFISSKADDTAISFPRDDFPLEWLALERYQRSGQGEQCRWFGYVSWFQSVDKIFMHRFTLVIGMAFGVVQGIECTKRRTQHMRSLRLVMLLNMLSRIWKSHRFQIWNVNCRGCDRERWKRHFRKVAESSMILWLAGWPCLHCG